MKGFTRALLNPVALALLTAAIFDWLTGNSIHALFLGIVGIALMIDRATPIRRRSPGKADRPHGRPARAANITAPAPHGRPSSPGALVLSAIGAAQATPGEPIEGEAQAVLSDRIEGLSLGHRHWRRMALLAAAAVSFALSVAAFQRFSWVTTSAVAALSAFAICRAWKRFPRSASRVAEAGGAEHTYPRAGFIAWAVGFAAGALWELAALLQQPSLKVGSYDHPTISVIMDSVLTAYWGRALTLLAWLTLGWLIFRELED